MTMLDPVPAPLAPPAFPLGIVGMRAILCALPLGAFNALRVFGVVRVSPAEAEAINGIIVSLISIFLALKGNRILGALAALQGTASAGAATAAALAQAQGVEHVPDPAATTVTANP